LIMFYISNVRQNAKHFKVLLQAFSHLLTLLTLEFTQMNTRV